MLDMQPNGTFTMNSCSNNEKSLSNNDNTLVCGDFSWDDCQQWRRENKFIKSEKTHGYLGIYIPENDEYVDRQVHPVDSLGSDGVSRPEQCVTVKGHPSLVISCKATGDKQQLKCECAITKVVCISFL